MKRQVRYKGYIAGLLASVMIAGACSGSGAKTGGATNTTSGQTPGTSAGGSGTVTIKVAGFGDTSQVPGAEIGAEARFQRFNTTNEDPGVRIQFVQQANDQGDPATALSVARQLVSQDQVFAVVPALSSVTPGAYLTAQHVPFVGAGFDSSVCSNTAPTTSIWGFGVFGCWVPSSPPYMPDLFFEAYKYMSTKTGKTHPAMVLFSSDTQTGKATAQHEASAAEGAGFDVVSAKGNIPTITSDYTPYVQQWLTANGGKQPDVITCALALQCVAAYQAAKAAGFTGTFQSPLGPIDQLAKPLAGTITYAFYNTQPNAGLTQMQADLNAFKPGTPVLGYSNVYGYFSADMFVQALKKIGKHPTPQGLQQVLAHQTWQIPGLVGPTTYPASTVAPTPECSELLLDSTDGSGFAPLAPYSCSYKHYPINPKFTG